MKEDKVNKNRKERNLYNWYHRYTKSNYMPTYEKNLKKKDWFMETFNSVKLNHENVSSQQADK